MLGFNDTDLCCIASAVIVLCIYTYIHLKYYVYNYWKHHGIPHEKPSIPLENISWLFIRGKISLGKVLMFSL